MEYTLQERLRGIKALVSSVSGVLHNNQDIVGTFEVDGKAMPFQGFMRSHYDGQGVSILRAVGVHVAFIATDLLSFNDPIVRMMSRWNKDLPSAKSFVWHPITLMHDCVGEAQIPPVQKWLQSLGLTFADCAIMGHDLVQVPLMQAAAAEGAVLIAPAQAEKVVKKMNNIIVTERPGGNGALRDFANMVLDARGIDSRNLPTR